MFELLISLKIGLPSDNAEYFAIQMGQLGPSRVDLQIPHFIFFSFFLVTFMEVGKVGSMSGAQVSIIENHSLELQVLTALLRVWQEESLSWQQVKIFSIHNWIITYNLMKLIKVETLML